MARLAAASVTVKFASNYVRELAGKADPKMRLAAAAIADYQRTHIPVGRDESHGRPPGYAQSRIGIRVTVGAAGLKVYEIGSDATTADGFPYPVVLDVGSRPHTIRSHGEYPMRTAEGEVLGREVEHPGTQPTNWCRGSLSVVRGVLG